VVGPQLHSFPASKAISQRPKSTATDAISDPR
jgi:hypothetical protein